VRLTACATAQPRRGADKALGSAVPNII